MTDGPLTPQEQQELVDLTELLTLTASLPESFSLRERLIIAMLTRGFKERRRQVEEDVKTAEAATLNLMSMIHFCDICQLEWYDNGGKVTACSHLDDQAVTGRALLAARERVRELESTVAAQQVTLTRLRAVLDRIEVAVDMDNLDSAADALIEGKDALAQRQAKVDDKSLRNAWKREEDEHQSVLQQRQEIAAQQAEIARLQDRVTYAERRWADANECAKQLEATVAAQQATLDRVTVALRAILQSTRDDEKGEQWTIRTYLNERGVYNENISSSRRLVAEACREALAALGPATRNASCTCWLGDPGATFGDSHQREMCAVHGDGAALGPATPEK